jgi:divalent metal cation (Fe/Co/Zn/Cd) transporter
MDRAPAGAYETAAAAIRRIRPPVRLGRLRIRQAAGRHFADVVIEVSPDAAVGQGHAAADAVERAIERALPESDVVVHVEPAGAKTLRERVQAAAVAVPRVREVHNVSAVDTEDGTAVSLHLKLPGSLPLEEAHAVASEVERAIAEAVPGIASVQTHLEPLAEQMGGGAPSEADASRIEEAITDIVRERTERLPRELRLLHTERGLVAFLTVQVDSRRPLVSAHSEASEIEERIRAAVPDLDDVVVHTEP